MQRRSNKFILKARESFMKKKEKFQMEINWQGERREGSLVGEATLNGEKNAGES